MENAILLIDIQNDYFAGGRNELHIPERAAAHAREALELFRRLHMPVFHVQHISIKKGATYFLPDSFGAEIHESVAPLTSEKVIIKHAPNAFWHTDLASELQKQGVRHLVVCGMMSHMCIDTTVRAAKDFDLSVTVLENACTTKDLLWHDHIIPAETVHNTMMASLNGAFANVQKTEDYLASIINDR